MSRRTPASQEAYITPPPYHTADLGLPGLIPSGRGDDQDHAERGDVGPPRAPAAAPETPDRATLPRPPPLPRGRALARADRCAVARPTTRADELAHRLAPAAKLDGIRRMGPDHRRAAGDGAGRWLGGAHARQHHHPRPHPRRWGQEGEGRAGARSLAGRVLDQAPPAL